LQMGNQLDGSPAKHHQQGSDCTVMLPSNSQAAYTTGQGFCTLSSTTSHDSINVTIRKCAV